MFSSSGIISDPCDVEADCYDAVPDSTCTSGTCSCLSGYRSNATGEECIKRKLFLKKSSFPPDHNEVKCYNGFSLGFFQELFLMPVMKTLIALMPSLHLCVLLAFVPVQAVTGVTVQVNSA